MKVLAFDVTPVSASVLINKLPPIIVVAAYVRPNAPEEVSIFNEHLRAVLRKYPNVQTVVMGDVNYTTNLRKLNIPLKCVTPAEPNFVRINCGTRPTRVYISDPRAVLHSFVRDTPYGDGHRTVGIHIITSLPGLCFASMFMTRKYSMCMLTDNVCTSKPAAVFEKLSCNMLREVMRRPSSAALQRVRCRGRQDVVARLNTIMKASVPVCGPTVCIRDDGVAVSDATQVRDVFVKHFKVRWGDDDQIPCLVMPCDSPCFTAVELKEALNSLKPNKVTFDFSSDALKDMCSQSSELERNLLDSLNTWIPQDVHVGTALLLKPGKAPSPSNFRPIAILPLKYKLWRTLWARRIMTTLLLLLLVQTPRCPTLLQASR
jgi:hypothetical protein